MTTDPALTDAIDRMEDDVHDLVGLSKVVAIMGDCAGTIDVDAESLAAIGRSLVLATARLKARWQLAFAVAQFPAREPGRRNQTGRNTAKRRSD